MIETRTVALTRTAAVAAVVLLLAALAAPVGAKSPRTVTHGDFAVFAGGQDLGYEEIVGTAQMVRHRGETEVEVEIESGLLPGAQYGSHVHNQRCDKNNAGGHYQFPSDYGEVAGAVPFGGGYEIWPGPFTAESDGSAEGHTTVLAIAGPDAVSVVIHAPAEDGGAKIACADLK